MATRLDVRPTLGTAIVLALGLALSCVHRTATTLTLVASAREIPAGTPVNLVATIDPADATGAVTFHDGKTSLGTVKLDGFGQAVLRLRSLAVGKHRLTASYDGSKAYAASTSNVSAVAVTSR